MPESFDAKIELIDEKIISIRDEWHTKNHPLFQELAKGKLELKILGIHQAMHSKFVVLALEAFGLLYNKGDSQIKKMCVFCSFCSIFQKYGFSHVLQHYAL